MSEPGLADPVHAAAVVGGVALAALRDTGARGFLVLESDTPEGRLASAWLRAGAGDDRVFDGTAIGTPPAVPNEENARVVRAENERAAARLHAREHGLLLAHPASKTVLLLSGWPPPERLLPLGDIYASAIRTLAGGCTLPEDVGRLAKLAGGLERLDEALWRWLEGRRPLTEALASLPAEARTAVGARLRANRSARRWPRCVPKLGVRTLWIDIFA